MADYGATTEQPVSRRDDGGENSVKLMDEYNHGLCDCMNNWGNCCLVFWCYPVASCMVSHRLAENYCYPLCFGALPLSVRFRSVARIEQSMCEEACHFLWCPPCALCRMMNEMDTRSFEMERV